MSKSNRYNPFIIYAMTWRLMMKLSYKHTTPSGQKSKRPVLEKSETALLQALCFYLINEQDDPQEEFLEVMRLLRMAEVMKQSGQTIALGYYVEEVAERDENSIALKQYRIFKQGAGKTLNQFLFPVPYVGGF